MTSEAKQNIVSQGTLTFLVIFIVQSILLAYMDSHTFTLTYERSYSVKKSTYSKFNNYTQISSTPRAELEGMKAFTKGLLLTFHGVGDTVVDPSVLVKGKHWGRGLLWPIDPASVLKRDNPLIKLISYQIAHSGSTTLYAVVFLYLKYAVLYFI